MSSGFNGDLLLAAYGSTLPEAQEALVGVEEYLARALPGVSLHWCFTSRYVRRKAQERGSPLPSPQEALRGMAARGSGPMGVLPLFVSTGGEFTSLQENVQDMAAQGAGRVISMGSPLCSGPEEIKHLALRLARARGLAPGRGEGLLFIMHGSAHPDAPNFAQAAELISRELPGAYLAGLEHPPGLGQVLEQGKALGLSAWRLIPLFLWPGKHVTRDLGGEQGASWASRIKEAGYSCRISRAPLCLEPFIRREWLSEAKYLLGFAGP